jgi:hypothetical protein
MSDMSEAKIEDAYLAGTSWASYRYGEAARIDGVKIVIPPGRPNYWDQYEPRPCFEVVFADGVRDHVAISDVGSGYEIITRPEADEINRKHAETERRFAERKRAEGIGAGPP